MLGRSPLINARSAQQTIPAASAGNACVYISTASRANARPTLRAYLSVYWPRPTRLNLPLLISVWFTIVRNEGEVVR